MHAKTKAGGDPVQSSSDVGIKAEKPRKRAAGDRSEVEASTVEPADAKKRKSAVEGEPVLHKRTKRGVEHMSKKAMPENINYFLYQQLKDKLAMRLSAV